jgi:prepilin-type N-terminal cleavage/methylation domain-containing protein
MRYLPTQSARPAFTLLEVLLASAIAVLLLAGLYVAMQVELRQAAVGREVVENSTLSRAIINRMTTDLAPSITPPGAKTKAKSSGGGGMGANANAAASTDTSSSSTIIPLQAGVIGQSDTLTIFTSRVPDPTLGITAGNQSAQDGPIPSDVRRISYWLHSSGVGLCRQEVPWFSGDDYQSQTTYVIPQGQSEDDFVIAKEVTALSFEYYDINSTTDDGGWNDYWTGSDPGPDNSTPKGPPTAIRVHFTLTMTDPDGKTTSKDYSHVIPILTASGPTPSSSGTATGSGM